MTRINRIIFFIVLIFALGILKAQTTAENWVPVMIDEDQSLFINVTGLSAFTGQELFVWSLQEMNVPITMEGVNQAIYKTKTYYHINKETRRYSILQIIFYDKRNNVIKQYSYEHKSDKPEFIFNNPIVRNSDMEKILQKCNSYIKADGGTSKN